MNSLHPERTSSNQTTAADFVAADGYPLALHQRKGIDYAATLFTHSAWLYPFAPSYLQSQLNELTGPCRKAHLHDLARSCLLLGQQVEQGRDPRATLAMLSSHHQYQHTAEYISRALLNCRYLQHQRQANELLEPAEAVHDMESWSLPFALHHAVRPVPASLTRALLRWPDNDKLFTQALAILHRQPALASLVCRYATAYTPQGKHLELKPALLLLGPQRSRELVLLAHFESNLSKPVFPLRAPILKRRALIQHMLGRLAQALSVSLPCRAELIAYLLVYDAWRSPRWTSQNHLQADPRQHPWKVDSWLKDTRPANHRVALRLCQYWGMPKTLSDALQLKHLDPRLNALMALSIVSVHVLSTAPGIHLGNDGNQHINDTLNPWFDTLTSSGVKLDLARYAQILSEAAIDARYTSELPAGMRP